MNLGLPSKVAIGTRGANGIGAACTLVRGTICAYCGSHACARPRDLPMQQPTRFEFVVNLRMTKAMGLTIPQSVLLRPCEAID